MGVDILLAWAAAICGGIITGILGYFLFEHDIKKNGEDKGV